jgi:hypothetical protein
MKESSEAQKSFDELFVAWHTPVPNNLILEPPQEEVHQPIETSTLREFGAVLVQKKLQS